MCSSISVLVSAWMLNVRGAPMLAVRRVSVRMIYIRTCGRAWQRCGAWVCGSALLAIRLPVPGRYCGNWPCPLI